MQTAASACGRAACPADELSREWLALPGGGIRRVVTVGGELLAHAAFAARPIDPCPCGRARLGSGRTCGSAACVAALRQAAAQQGQAEPG